MKESEEYMVLKVRVPHIADKMLIFWGTEYFPNYVRHLMLDTRDGKRKGFPKDVLTAILELQKQHETQFSFSEKQTKDIWDDGTFRWYY